MSNKYDNGCETKRDSGLVSTPHCCCRRHHRQRSYFIHKISYSLWVWGLRVFFFAVSVYAFDWRKCGDGGRVEEAFGFHDKQFTIMRSEKRKTINRHTLWSCRDKKKITKTNQSRKVCACGEKRNYFLFSSSTDRFSWPFFATLFLLWILNERVFSPFFFSFCRSFI